MYDCRIKTKKYIIFAYKKENMLSIHLHTIFMMGIKSVKIPYFDFTKYSLEELDEKINKYVLFS